MNDQIQNSPDGGKASNNFARVLRWFDAHTEPYLMVMFYVALALIISIEVARRYLLGEQTQWGSVVSIYCFIWLSWLGCAYHVKTRGHLRFGELRGKMPKVVQAFFYIFDDVLWLVLASVVVTSSWNLIQSQMLLENMIEGTRSIPLAVATAAVPIGWLLIVVRAIQDIWRVIYEFRNNIPFKASAETLSNKIA